MSLFGKLFGKLSSTFSDPDLGELKRDNQLWWGTAVWPHSDIPVAMNVFRMPEEPNDADRIAYRSFKDRYQSLSPSLKTALFQLWQQREVTDSPAQINPQSEHELWDMLVLQGISIHHGGKIELCYGFPGDIWLDAAFMVAVRGSFVEPVGFEA